MEENKKKVSILTIILIVLVIALLVYICLTGDFIKPKNNIYGSKGLKVIDSTFIRDAYDDEGNILIELQNNSGKEYMTAEPVLIFYDSNGTPFHYAWAAQADYFGAGETQVFRYYDIVQDYARAEVGFFDDDQKTVVDLRDKIVYTTEERKVEGEDYSYVIDFDMENTYDKELSLQFNIDYHDPKGNLVYADEFITVLDPNTKETTYEIKYEKFGNGESFPEGTTYKAYLASAVEYVPADFEEDENTNVNVEGIVLSKDLVETEDKIESAMFKVLDQTYGEDYDSAKIYVEKWYTSSDVINNEMLSDLNLKDTDVAFEVDMYILPAEGVDYTEFMIPNGVYDEDSGYVQNVTRVGVLRYDQESDTYSVTDLGTAW